MKRLSPNCPLASQTLHDRSPVRRAIAFYNNRAEICASACVAALLLACLGIPAAHAGSLGRLFFTPEQRAQLDYNYARNAPAEGDASPFLTVNGIVQKNGGPRTVWINGVSQAAGNRGERNPAEETVTVPGKSHPVKVKVGQKILLDQPVQTHQDATGE